MDMTPILIVATIAAGIVALFVGPGYLKSRERREIQTTVRHAIDKGQQLPPDLIDAMTKDVASKLPSRTRDLRRGVLWLAIGIGVAAFSYLTSLSWNDHEMNEAMAATLGLAAIPATIGIAFIVLSFFNPNKE